MYVFMHSFKCNLCFTLHIQITSVFFKEKLGSLSMRMANAGQESQLDSLQLPSPQPNLPYPNKHDRAMSLQPIVVT